MTTLKEKIRVVCRLRPTLAMDNHDNPTPQLSPRLAPFSPDDAVPEPSSTSTSPSTVRLSPDISQSTFLSSETDAGTVENTIQSFTKDGSLVYSSNFGGDFKTFKYDSCAGPTVSQAALYAANCEDIINGVWNGYHGTILAYGQTGSGKTYTMRGPSTTINTSDNDAVGMIPRALSDLFARRDSLDDPGDVTFSISYLQIYCEMLHDMLIDESLQLPLSIREKGGRVYVENLASVPVTTAAECLKVLEGGDLKRTTAKTLLNASSSRSHAAMIFTVRRRTGGKVTDSNLVMVDLAGSERAKKSGAQYQQFEELKAINLSLSALGNCVSALAAGRKHVPFRDSKLTRLLQNSIGGTCGNSRTALIVCTRPGADDGGETYSSLMFAHRASAVKVVAKLNEVMDYEKLYKDLVSKNDVSDNEVHKLELQLATLKTQLETAKSDADDFSQQRDALSKKMESLEKGFHASLEAVGGEEGEGADLIDAIETVSEKWQCEIESLQQEHCRELESAKIKFEQKLAAYKSAANSREFEQENVDHELLKERENHLETLKMYTTVSDKLKVNESENSNRIAELLAELNMKNDQIDEHSTMLQKKEADHSKVIESVENRMKELEISGNERKNEMVSRDSVLEMETLFSETIDKLVNRVNMLESQAKENKIIGEISNVGKNIEKGRARNLDAGARNMLEEMEANLNPFGGVGAGSGGNAQVAPGRIRVRKQAF